MVMPTKVYIPIVDCNASRKAYKCKAKAEKEMRKEYEKYILDRPWLQKYPYSQLCYLDTYELA